MPQVDTDLILEVPTKIIIRLIRADHLFMSNVFRIFFEVFLAISSGLIIAIVFAPVVTKLHWAFLCVTGLSAILFLALSLGFGGYVNQDAQDHQFGRAPKISESQNSTKRTLKTSAALDSAR